MTRGGQPVPDAEGPGRAGPAHEVVVSPSPDVLASAVAERLLVALTDAQAGRGSASLGLTGGGIGIALLEQVARSALRDTVDWNRVDLWWGDERFVPRASPDRNERQARDALLDALPLDPSRVHPMPASDEAADPEEAAARYAAVLETAPPMDVLLLGLGGEGHVASIFPDSPASRATGWAVGVRDCPKPPPERVSLTFEALNRAREVWMVAAGQAKAEAVALALSGTRTREQLPAAGVRGTARTLWLLDVAAAAGLRA